MSIPADSVECPVCGRVVPAKQEECPGCGSDLAMSTLEELETIARRLSDLEKPKEAPKEVPKATPEPRKEAPRKSEPEPPKPAPKEEEPKMEPPKEKPEEQKPAETPKTPEIQPEPEEKHRLGKLFGKRKK